MVKEHAIIDEPILLEGAERLTDVVCVACGCLCDDLTVYRKDGRTVGVETRCHQGRSYFLEQVEDADEPDCRVNGRPCALEEGIAEAATILRSARSALIDGLARTTVEAQRLAVMLAQAVRGVTLAHSFAHHTQFERAWLSSGGITATLGEVKNRADLVICWRADPQKTHPRHFEKYSLDPIGRFIPRGRRDRTLVVIDSEENISGDLADYCIRIAPGRDVEAASVLRAILRGVPFDVQRVSETTGVALETWNDLAAILKRARYGVMLHDPSRHPLGDVNHDTQALLALVRDLNDVTAFAYVPLVEAGNAVGAVEVLGWLAGSAGCVDFAGGTPKTRGEVRSADELLQKNAVDAALFIQRDPLMEGDPEKWQWLGRIPVIALGSRSSPLSDAATVSFRTAKLGRSVVGTIFRSDGVALPLHPLEVTSRLADADILERLLQFVAAVPHSGTTRQHEIASCP